jgi:hypothetical protein
MESPFAKAQGYVREIGRREQCKRLINCESFLRTQKSCFSQNHSTIRFQLPEGRDPPPVCSPTGPCAGTKLLYSSATLQS